MGEVTGGVAMLLLAPEEAEGVCKLAGLEVEDWASAPSDWRSRIHTSILLQRVKLLHLKTNQ